MLISSTVRSIVILHLPRPHSPGLLEFKSVSEPLYVTNYSPPFNHTPTCGLWQVSHCYTVASIESARANYVLWSQQGKPSRQEDAITLSL